MFVLLFLESFGLPAPGEMALIVRGARVATHGDQAPMFGGDPASNAIKGPATIPEALWELFLGVYCTIWGFRRDAPILSGNAS